MNRDNFDCNFYNIEELVSRDTENNLPPKSKFIPKQPCRMLVSGQSGSGKTCAVIQMILHHLHCERLYVCSKHLDNDRKYDLLKSRLEEQDSLINKRLNKKRMNEFEDLHTTIQCWTTDIDDFVTLEELDENYINVVLFDDLVCLSKKKQKEISEFFVRGRHKNCTVFYLTQSFYQVPRLIRLNCGHFMLFNSACDTEIKRICKEVCSGIDNKEFCRLFKEGTTDYNFFFIDTTAKNKNFRFRKNLNGIDLVDNV